MQHNAVSYSEIGYNTMHCNAPPEKLVPVPTVQPIGLPEGTQRRAPTVQCSFKAILCNASQRSLVHWIAKEWVQQCTKVLCNAFNL